MKLQVDYENQRRLRELPVKSLVRVNKSENYREIPKCPTRSERLVDIFEKFSEISAKHCHFLIQKDTDEPQVIV